MSSSRGFNGFPGEESWFKNVIFIVQTKNKNIKKPAYVKSINKTGTEQY